MATIDKLREYRSFIRILKKMSLCVGLWPVTETNKLQRLLPTIGFISCAMASYVIMNFVLIYHADIPAMTSGLGLAGSYMTTALKIFCVDYNREILKVLHATLDRFIDKVLNESTIRSEVLNKFSTFRKLSVAFTCFVFSSVTAHILAPMFHMISQLIRQVEPIEYASVIPAVYPWTSSGGLLFCCEFVFESLSAYVIFFVATSVNVRFLVYIYQISGTLTAMSYQLTNLQDNDDDYDAIVRECVKNYVSLLECCGIIETIYGPIVLWMAGTSAIVLCTDIFRISTTDDPSFGFLCVIIAYMGAEAMQTFMCAWAGSVLTTESEKFAEAIYASNWAGSGRIKFMSSILIMVTQRPLVITVCHFSTVSIDMFAKILNTAVSYFFLLRTMQDKTS
uniref:Odorant receptor n=1 Tax=Meteorus pulchricornis TaxID=51522 RepID=A0A1S5VFP8_9HYME|nr:olfactory receptor 64 [Meteorus pulchricornis]